MRKPDLDTVGSINNPNNHIVFGNIKALNFATHHYKIIINMEIKYIVKSDKTPNMYLVADTELGNRTVPYAFKPCVQVIYEVAIFNSLSRL